MTAVNMNPAPRVGAVVPKPLPAPLPSFQLLEQAFAAKGWRLYPLYGDTLFLTIPKWGMSRTLPSIQAAQELLNQIGGAA
jgi:hypothetical protein